jgi:hypothetical protein
MASQSHDSTFNFDFDFAMPQQSFDGGLKTSGQGNTASGYFDEGIDTTGSNGSLFGQQSFEPMMDPSMITGFGMEQPLVSVPLCTRCVENVGMGRRRRSIACQGSFGSAIPQPLPLPSQVSTHLVPKS